MRAGRLWSQSRWLVFVGDRHMIHRAKNATHGESVALNIRNRQVEELAAALAALAGETKTEAVKRAVQERLDRLRRSGRKQRLVEEINEIAQHCSSLAVIDARSPDEILGYDEHGLPR